jgi:low affinity Fe/Cu permease
LNVKVPSTRPDSTSALLGGQRYGAGRRHLSRVKEATLTKKDPDMVNRRLWFANFAQEVSQLTGRPITFLVALAIILVWALVGPLAGYSDTWQLIINTATTIITFLMVFVIQNTQNRDTAAMHIKIDELIRVTQKARNVLLDLEELDDETLELLRKDYEKLARKAKSQTRTPLRAKEVPARPSGSNTRNSK